MKLFLGMVIGLLWSKIFGSQPEKAVPQITAAPATATATTTDQNSLPADDDKDGFSVETRDASPSHFLTKINSFSLFSQYGIDRYETKEFEAGDYKWRLIIYPDGRDERSNQHVSVYLAMADTSSLPADWEFNVVFTIFLYDQISDNYLCFRVNGGRRFFNQTVDEWGFSKFISTKNLRNKSNGYLVDDKLVLGAEVFVLKRQRVIESVTLLEPKNIPCKHSWVITEFSKLEDVWVSGEFTVDDIKWEVILHPNGYNLGPNDRQISVFLECLSADSFGVHKKIKTDYCFRLKGRVGFGCNSGKASRWFSSSVKCCGFSHFLCRDVLLNPKNSFLDNDCFTLEVVISMQVVVE